MKKTRPRSKAKSVLPETKSFELTAAQKEAVRGPEGNMIVSAGAGAGKTRVLVERYLHWVVSGRALVTEILALTFTDKAAGEMKKRIMDRLKELGLEGPRRDLESAYISTIHAFAARLLREHPLEAGVDPDFRVLETEESEALREEAADKILEAGCREGSPVFDLLRVYGERRVRDGISHLYDCARHEGVALRDFCSAGASRRAVPGVTSPADFFDKLGESGLAARSRAFEKIKEWDWRLVSDYRDWQAEFSRKRGKKGETLWTEARAACRIFLSERLSDLAAPWAEAFGALAIDFEGAYEAGKKERGALDFDDLQARAIALFERPDAVRAKLIARYRQKFRQVMVDEFQDTNRLQLRLVELFSRGDNLFLVGDFKQSIYGFRGAEPAVFSDKEREYGDPARGRRIPLAENFRTDETVLRFINGFFRVLWAEDGLEYEPLIPRAEKSERAAAELILVRDGEDSMALARMREADCIAEKILDLAEEGYKFGDIAVLFQAMTDVGIYEQALKKRQIPYFTLSGGGFYYQSEIRDIMSYLAFLDNPLADIPLAAALRSPVFQVSDNTLFWLSRRVKEADRGAPLYGGVKAFEAIPEIPEHEKDKLRFFSAVTGDLLAVKDRLKITELLDRILERTGYELTVLADPQGVRRYANLKKLVNLAREFERYEPVPLGAFLGTVRRLETQEVRESEAQVEAQESGRLVRLLSVHRAKGLEFPVVFVADLSHRKKSAEAKTVLAGAGMGFAVKVQNEITLEMEKPADWEALDELLDRKQREEWKRLFYVAVTRAKERLILSGAYKERKSEKESFRDMGSWMDWLMAAPDECLSGLRVIEPDRSPPRKRRLALAESADWRRMMEEYLSPEASGGGKKSLWTAAVKTQAARARLEAEAEANLAAVRPAERAPSRAVDLPVSAFAAFARSPAEYRAVYEIGYPDFREPGENDSGSIEDRELEFTAADFGTAMHRVLERLDFGDPEARLEDILRDSFRGLEGNPIPEARKIIEKFAASDVFRKLAGARRLCREVPFVLNERHGLIHGVIDVLYQDAAGRWHVLDYKTAEGSPEEIRGSGYETQVLIYAHAVREILGAAPVSATVYFLKNGWSHTLGLDPRGLEDWAGRLRDIQSEILRFSAVS